MSDGLEARGSLPDVGESRTPLPEGGTTAIRPKPGQRRPSPKLPRVTYSRALAEKVCTHIATGYSLTTIEQWEGMPVASTVYRWSVSIPEFAEMYRLAKLGQMQRWAEEIIELADDDAEDLATVQDGETRRTLPNPAAVQRAKLRIDTRKWLMARLAPQLYSEKITTENLNVNVNAGRPDDDLATMTREERMAEARKIAQQLGLALAEDQHTSRRSPSAQHAGLVIEGDAQTVDLPQEPPNASETDSPARAVTTHALAGPLPPAAAAVSAQTLAPAPDVGEDVGTGGSKTLTH